jgi:hypothetical protein
MNAIVLASLTALTLLATPAPNSVYQSLDTGKAHAAPSVSGTIASVDYPAGTIVVKTAHGAQAVSIVPNTSIYRGNAYIALSDLHSGESVEIAVSVVGGRLVAQTVVVKTP